MRKTNLLTIAAEGRDKGKQFLLTEMSAVRAEKWAYRVLNGLAKSGVDIPPDVSRAGMAGLAALGARALLSMDMDTAGPLLDEMLLCAQFIPDPARPQVVRTVIEDDIEEVATLFTLRREILDLHFAFSATVAALISSAAAAVAPAESPSSAPTSPAA